MTFLAVRELVPAAIVVHAIYHPLTRDIIRIADRMKVLQAGSLHAYLGYVLLLALYS